jgi:hypothetical protein
VGGELNIGTPDTCLPLYALTLVKKTHKNFILPFPLRFSQGTSNPFLSKLFYFFTSFTLHPFLIIRVLDKFFSLTMPFVHCFFVSAVCNHKVSHACTQSNLKYSIPETFVPGLNNFEDLIHTAKARLRDSHDVRISS